MGGPTVESYASGTGWVVSAAAAADGGLGGKGEAV